MNELKFSENKEEETVFFCFFECAKQCTSSNHKQNHQLTANNTCGTNTSRQTAQCHFTHHSLAINVKDCETERCNKHDSRRKMKQT